VKGPKTATYQGRTFKIFQDATATVQYVTGEFYWKVQGGEQARAIDYVRAPEMLSLELSTTVPQEVYDSFGKTPINWAYTLTRAAPAAKSTAAWEPISARRKSRRHSALAA